MARRRAPRPTRCEAPDPAELDRLFAPRPDDGPDAAADRAYAVIEAGFRGACGRPSCPGCTRLAELVTAAPGAILRAAFAAGA